MSTRTWDATDGVLASTDANWVGGVKPVAGDNILFDVNSAAHNCTFDLALALGSFTMTADYSGTITQAASFSVAGFSIAAGIYTGSTSYILSDSQSFIQSGGIVTSGVLRLVMSGDGSSISLVGAYWSVPRLFGLQISANVTLSSFACMTDTAGSSYLTIDAGKTLTTTTGKKLLILTTAGFTLINNGIINGAGTLSIWSGLADKTFYFGIVNCPFEIQDDGSSSDNRVITIGVNTVFGSTVSVSSSHATHTATLDLSASNYALSATAITIGTRGILNGRGSVITCNGTFDSSAGAFTQGTSTLIMGATGNLKCAADGAYNLRVAEGVTTTLTAALNVYKDLRNMGTLTRGANTVSLLGAGEQTVSGYPDTAITVNSTGPVIFHECAVTHADVTATAGTLVWTGYGRYVTHGNLSISAISRNPTSFDDVQNLNGTLTFDAESRMKDLTTDAGQTTVQSAGVQLGISGKIATAGTFTQNTPTKITRDYDQARLRPFPVQFCVNQPKGWGDA